MSETDTRPRLSVVMPVYDEVETIEEILVRVQEVDIDKEIVLIDDMSTDGTRELLHTIADAVERGEASVMLPNFGAALRLGAVRVLFQDRNRGKGAALRRGFEAARGEIVLVQDADLEYDPHEYPRLIEPIESGRADVVYGSRFAGAGTHRVLYFWHSVGNKFLTLMSNMLTNLNLGDVWTCYKVFHRDAVQVLELTEPRFGVEVEMTAQLARAKLRIYEVPIDYHGRTYEQGKKITWRDGVKALWQTLKHNLLR